MVSQVLLCGLRTQAADVDTVGVWRLQAQAEVSRSAALALYCHDHTIWGAQCHLKAHGVCVVCHGNKKAACSMRGP